MSSVNLEGIGRINGGEYDTLTVEGVGSCSNDIKVNNMHIEGVFKCSGVVDARDLYCEGVADFKSNIRAKRLTVDGVMTVKNNSKIEAEEIICDGVLKSGGEISADILKADGCVEAREIVGDQIDIYSYNHTKRFMNLFTRVKSDVRLIEATTINLRGVTAETVNGRDIIIGPGCVIDNLDCNGTLSIDKKSEVRNITGNYTMRD